MNSSSNAVSTPDRSAWCTPSLRRVHCLASRRASAYELVARGELPVIRLGRRRLVPKAALGALVAFEQAANPIARRPKSAVAKSHERTELRCR